MFVFILYYLLTGFIVTLFFCGSGLFNERYVGLSVLFIFLFWPFALIILFVCIIAILIYKIFYRSWSLVG